MKLERLVEIKKYIREYYEDKYTGSDLQYTEDDDKEGLIEAIDTFFWSDYLFLCGCGDPDQVKSEIRKYLNYLIIEEDNEFINKEEYLQYHFGITKIYESSLLMFMVYVLNKYDIVWHGGNVNHSWLTEFGRMWLDVLNERL